MITSIILNNFKGRSERVELDRYNLFCGVNGSGKSAIAEAVTLALTGYVKGVKRQNQEIFHKMFSNIGDPLVTEHSVGFVFKAKGILLEFKRAFSAGKGEHVAQEYFVGGKKVSKDQYNKVMAESRVPGIFDIEAFMEFSDEKKINAIFERFGDLEDDVEVDSKIDTSKTKINKLNGLIKVNTGVTQKLSVARAEYELPDGSLAEVNNEIEKVAAEVKLANQHLTKLRIAEAKKEKEDELEKKNKDTLEAAQEIFGDPPAKPAVDNLADIVTGVSQLSKPDTIDESYLNDTDTERLAEKARDDRLSPRDSIQKIINAIKSVGCVLCSNGAGIMVAKSELKKYEVNDEAN